MTVRNPSQFGKLLYDHFRIIGKGFSSGVLGHGMPLNALFLAINHRDRIRLWCRLAPSFPRLGTPFLILHLLDDQVSFLEIIQDSICQDSASAFPKV